jgi:phospholipid transport system substrate-binding protein
MKVPLKLSLLFCFVAWAANASPVRPMDLVKSTADKIIAILNDPRLQAESQTSERHHRIRQELEERFDWTTICRSCLGRHWAGLSRGEQNQFLTEFKNFLEHTYLDRIEPYYNELDHIEYLGERILDNDYASVKTVVITKQKIDHPVEYRLEKTASGDWRVYDVIIEGVSLVKNYRTQFDEILAKSSFQKLIDDLKTRQIATKQPSPK